MDFDVAMQRALELGPAECAIACVDLRAGMVLGLSARTPLVKEAASSSALAAAQLCIVPRLDAGLDDVEVYGDDGIVISTRWVHAFARVVAKSELVVVGVADGSANVALLLAWVKRVGATLGGGP